MYLQHARNEAVSGHAEMRLAKPENSLSSGKADAVEVARATNIGILGAAIAHEISQPISGIIANAAACLRMLDRELPCVEGALQTARCTLRDGKRAAEIVDRLRSLFTRSKIDAESADLTIEAIDINDVVLEALVACQPRMSRDAVCTRIELQNSLPRMHIDRVQIRQVLQNLVANACDAMAGIEDRARLLGLQTVRAGPTICVSVTDTGSGIDPQDSGRIFEPEFTTKAHGMGLGLFLSRSIVEKHGGRLTAGNNEGSGATFTFELPCPAPMERIRTAPVP